MLKKSTLSLLSALLSVVILFHPIPLLACGHDGFYVGFGYNQLFMWTTEQRTSLGDSGSVNFGPGFGGHVLLGYDFCGSRWGIQMPFEFTRQRLDRAEWVNQFGTEFEGVLHLAEWQGGFGVHLLGGVGWVYLDEGKIANRSNSGGVTASFGPGMSYYFHRDDKISTALNLEVPFRMIHYFGDRLSNNGTTVIAFPIRIGLQVGF